MNIEVNFLSVLIAAIVSMVVGFVWYSPMLFAKPWTKLMGHSAESMKAKQKEMSKTYLISFALSILTAYVLYHTIVLSENFFHYDHISTGLISAFWMWLGFVMPVQMTNVLFGKDSWKLFGINTGYQLVSLLAIGLTLGILM